MGQLCKYELKKILTRKLNLIAMLLGLCLVVFVDLSLIQGESLYLSEDEQLTGLAAIRKKDEMQNALTSRLSEEFITDTLREYQDSLQDNEEYNYAAIASKSGLFALIAENYVEWNEDWGWEDLARIPIEDGTHFYERRLEKIRTMLDADYSYGNYTAAEKDYWMEKAEAVSTPFAWGCRTAWSTIWYSITGLFYQLFVIGLCLAPVFAGEVQNRTDSLLLSSRYGKTLLIRAKLLSALLFTLGYMLVCAALCVGLHLALLGIDGWDLPVQLWNTIIPYHLNVAQACGLNLLLLLIAALLAAAATLLFSAVCKSPMIALALHILLFFGTVFLPTSQTSGLWNHIVCLRPAYTSNLMDVLETYISYPLGPVVISYPAMTGIVYISLTIVCLLLASWSFKKY